MECADAAAAIAAPRTRPDPGDGGGGGGDAATALKIPPELCDDDDKEVRLTPPDRPTDHRHGTHEEQAWAASASV